jgi:hypothetical protein
MLGGYHILMISIGIPIFKISFNKLDLPFNFFSFRIFNKDVNFFF